MRPHKHRARFVEEGAFYERSYRDRLTGKVRHTGMPRILRGFKLPRGAAVR